MNNNTKTFNITIIALLSGLNGMMELTLGNYLHIIKFPLRGAILVGINMVIYCLGYCFVPKKGTVLTMGFLTSLLNLFLGGAFKPWSILAIFLEAGMVEIMIAGLGFSIKSVILSSVSVNVFSSIYTFMTLGIITGQGFPGLFINVFSKILGNPLWVQKYLLLAGLTVFLINVITGCLFGFIGWQFSQKALRIAQIRQKERISDTI